MQWRKDPLAEDVRASSVLSPKNNPDVIEEIA
jgi:hypothetical protein